MAAITAAELKFYKSSASSSSANNTGGATITSLGGAINTATGLLTATNNDLFDAVPSSESQNGRTEYRCIYVRNENTANDLTAATVQLVNVSGLSANVSLAIAASTVAVNTAETTSLTDETGGGSPPATAGTFQPVSGTTSPAVSITTPLLKNNGFKSLWLRRTITAGAAATPVSFQVSVTGDTGAA